MFQLTSLSDFGRMQFLQAWRDYRPQERQKFFDVVQKYATGLKVKRQMINPRGVLFRQDMMEKAIDNGLRIFKDTEYVGTDARCVVSMSIVGISSCWSNGDYITHFNIVDWSYPLSASGHIDGEFPEGIQVTEIFFEFIGPSVLGSKCTVSNPMGMRDEAMLLDNDQFVTRFFGLSQVGGYKPE